MLIGLIGLLAACGFVRFGAMTLGAALTTPVLNAEDFGNRMTAGVVGMILCALVMGSTAEVLLP